MPRQAVAGEPPRRANKATDKEKLRRQVGYARHAGILRVAAEVLFEAADPA